MLLSAGMSQLCGWSPDRLLRGAVEEPEAAPARPHTRRPSPLARRASGAYWLLYCLVLRFAYCIDWN